MQAYHDLIDKVLKDGVYKEDRTGVGTYAIFGHQMRFDLSQGFPILTTKRVPFKLVVSELLWFLKGDTNIRYLLQHQNHIWDEWAFKAYVESSDYEGPDMSDFGKRALEDPDFQVVYQAQLEKFCQRILEDPTFAAIHGDLGKVYGKQWRSWERRDPQLSAIDQISQVIQDIKDTPDSRRLLVSAWNPEDVPSMALPPCHTLFQFFVADGKLSCQLYQRSADIFLGVPFNIAGYALLTHLIARECGLQVGEFIHTLGDAHLYSNHLDQARLLLTRDIRPLAQLKIEGDKGIFEIEPGDISLSGYKPHPTIKAPVAV